MEKTILLENIQRKHNQLATLLATLDEDVLCTPTLDGGWSIKDLMAHVSAWEQLCTEWLEMYVQSEIPDPFSHMRDGSDANERIFRENQNRSLQEVQENFSRTYQTFLKQVQDLTQTISEEDLNRPQVWLRQLPWLHGQSLFGLIADNSYEHYQNHGQQIRTWLEKAMA